MKKRIYGMLLMGAMVVASMSTFTSCKDYDDDISDLRSRIDALNKVVDQVNTQVTAGAIVTGVTPTSDGISISLSNGQSYSITNGKDGKDGTNGKDGKDGKDGAAGTVWSIGSDGYWYVDNGDGNGAVKTNYRAQGEDGKDGKDGLNGKDGKNGKNGADGKNGTNGKNGADGKDGQNGADGQDGCYYYPGTEGAEEGYWVKVDPNTGKKEITEISWQTGSVNGIVNDNTGEIIIEATGTYLNEDEIAAGARKAGVNKSYAYIFMGNNLRGLVFEKDQEGRLYTDGVPTIRVTTLTYQQQSLVSKNTSAEQSIDAIDSKSKKKLDATNFSKTVEAYYHVNPTNCRVEDLMSLSFVVKANADYKKTRTNATSDFNATAKFAGFKDGILKVKVDITGTPATAEKISVIALKAKRKVVNANVEKPTEKDVVAEEEVVSDYATVVSNPLGELFIANKKEYAKSPKVEYHFRRAEIENGISGLDDGLRTGAAVKNKKVWNTGAYANDADIELKYQDEVIDLNDYVQVHVEKSATDATKICDAYDIDKLDAFGTDDKGNSLTSISYEVVEDYKIGTNQTDQAKFIKLEGSKISARVFEAGQGEAAIDRTPVIRVILKRAGEIVKVAYIKVLIVRGKQKDPEPITITLNDFDKFACGKAYDQTTTVEQVNVGMYNHLGLSRHEFHSGWTILSTEKDGAGRAIDGHVAKGDVGQVVEIKETIDGVTTYLYKWTLTADEIWQNKGKKVTNVIRYEKGTQALDITLTSNVLAIKDKYNVESAEYMDAYWNTDKTIAYFNVNVPKSTSDADPDNCQYENDLNSPFETYATGAKIDGNSVEGILKLKEDQPAQAVTKIEYTFHSNNKGEKTFTDPENDENKVTTTLSISADGLRLLGPANEIIAEIDNDAWTTGGYTSAIPNIGRHIIKYNKNSDLAKQLLNTNAFTVDIMATGYICNEKAKNVKITFQGKEYYTAQYVRPITVGNKAADNFIDAVDLGEKGSYINIKDLINPIDWRGREFRLAKYNNYWGYYGPFKVTFDRADAQCDFQTKGTFKAIPATLDLQLDATANKYGKDAPYGYVTYHNNGTKLQDDRQIRLKVTVEYGWGKIKTPWIYVDVAETDDAPSK